MLNMSSKRVINKSESINKNLYLGDTIPEGNQSNYASACSSPVQHRFSTAEEPSNVSDIIPSIIAKNAVARETIDHRNIGVEISSFAHPTTSNEFDQTVQYSQSDLTFLSNSTITEFPSIIIDKGDVTHFVANVVENERVDYAKLRQILQNQDSSFNDTSNILENLAEPSKEENSTETEKIENEPKGKEDREERIEQNSLQLKLNSIFQERDQIREENVKLKIHSESLHKEIDSLREENESLKVDSDDFSQELNQLREENKKHKFDSNANLQELESLREENKCLKMKLDSQNDTKSHELEFIREENERLKLELHAYKRNTRPLSKSPSKDTKESKTIETRRNIFKDKLYFKLQLTKIDELEAETLADLVKEIMLILKIDDVNRVIPSIEQINKAMQLVPQLRDFIKTVILLVLNDYEEINQEFSSRMLPQDIPPEDMLKTAIDVLVQWRETVKDMETFASQLLRNSRRNTQQNFS